MKPRLYLQCNLRHAFDGVWAIVRQKGQSPEWDRYNNGWPCVGSIALISWNCRGLADIDFRSRENSEGRLSAPESTDLERNRTSSSARSSTTLTSTRNQRITIDESSAQSLLRDNTSSTDYNGSKGLPEITEDGSKVRQRQGFKSTIGSNFQVWRKKSTTFLSQRTASTFDGDFAQGKPGWWNKQMLVDRSLRTMAGFTSVCAIVMFIIVMAYVPAFSRRTNKSSTSVGGSSGESCDIAEARNTVSF